MGLGKILQAKRSLELTSERAAPEGPLEQPAEVSATLATTLQRLLAGSEPVRGGDGWLHASQLYDLCTRQVVLRGDAAVEEEVAANLRAVFDVGKAVHWTVRNKYLGPHGLLLGRWRCRRCGALVEGVQPQRCACGLPVDGVLYEYEETRLEDKELKIRASPDGFLPAAGVVEPVDGMGVLEIKSMEGFPFRRLEAPLPEHRFRTHVYMALAGLSWGVVLYQSKSYERSGNPFKAFALRYDPAVMDEVRRTIEEVRRGGERKCGAATEARARACVAREACFHGGQLAGSRGRS